MTIGLELTETSVKIVHWVFRESDCISCISDLLFYDEETCRRLGAK